MELWLIILLSCLGALVLICLGIALVCFILTFYSAKRTELDLDNFQLPPGESYEPFREQIRTWIKKARETEHKCYSIKSHDGLTLRAKYYECNPGGVVEILFNGYRSDAERDMSAAVERCFALGRNALIVNQRACGDSDGHVITFGAKERLDAIAWAKFAAAEFGESTPLILAGVSMGAATVLLASALELPKNVACILADCPYSSAKEIIKKVVKEDVHLPPRLVYPFICLGARIFGGFKLKDADVIKAVKKSNTPIIFIHGDNDSFVPSNMSTELYDACASEKKKLVFVKGAGHGLAYPVDKDFYLASIKDFEKEWI